MDIVDLKEARAPKYFSVTVAHIYCSEWTNEAITGCSKNETLAKKGSNHPLFEPVNFILLFRTQIAFRDLPSFIHNICYVIGDPKVSRCIKTRFNEPLRSIVGCGLLTQEKLTNAC